MVAIMFVHRVDGGLRRIFAQVASGGDVAIVFDEKRFGIAGPLHAPADDAQVDLARGRVLLLRPSTHPGKLVGITRAAPMAFKKWQRLYKLFF